MKIIVNITGPDNEPTADTKWYAQLEDGLPVDFKPGRDYAFGATPQKALTNLLLDLLKTHGMTIQ